MDFRCLLKKPRRVMAGFVRFFNSRDRQSTERI